MSERSERTNTHSRLRRIACLVLLSAVLLAVAAPAASAQDDDGSDDRTLAVRKIDGTDPSAVKVSIQYSGDSTDLADTVVRENGNVVDHVRPQSLAGVGMNLAMAVVVDVSPSAEREGRLGPMKDAIERLIEAKGEDDHMAILSFSSDVQVEQELTTDPDALLDAVEGLAAVDGGKTALWDGVTQAATLLDRQSELQPNLIVLTDGEDDKSSESSERALAAVARSGSAVFLLDTRGDDSDRLADADSLVDDAEGQYLSGDPDRIDASMDGVATALTEQQYLITYATRAEQGVTDLTVNVAGARDDASFVAGSIAEGASGTEALVGGGPGGLAFLRSASTIWVALALVLAAVALGVWAVISIIQKPETDLDSALEPYSGYGVSPDGEDAADDGYAQTALMQRAVQMTEDFAERQGVLIRVEELLERANLPLRAGEAMFFYVALVTVLSALALVLSGWNILVGLMAVVLLALVPVSVVKFLAKRRRKKFTGLLPDTLQLLSGSLRAGYSLMQGVEAVSQEVSEPMGRELRRVVTEARLGRDLEESLEAVADRMGSNDFAWAVMAIRIQREVGGNLSELLLTVGETMKERERLRREVAALTAEGKVSAFVLGLLPIGLGFAMWVMNPAYIGTLFTEKSGNIALGGSVMLAIAGFAWMKKMVEIEI